MTRLVILLISLLLIAYPFIVYISIESFSPRILGLLLLILVSSRFFLAKLKLDKNSLKSLLPLTVVSVLLALWIIFSNDPLIVKLNPVVVNVALLGLFLYSLFKPPSMIERFARLSEPELPEHAITYTRRVTMVWCLLFTFNGLMGLYTAIWSSFKFWALYNGLIAYLLVGLLFAVEFVIRQFVKSKFQKLESVDD